MAKTIEQVIALFGGTPADWVRHSRGDGWKRVGARAGYTPEQIKEYGRHIRYFWLWHKEESK